MDLSPLRKRSINEPSSPTIKPKNKSHLSDLVGNTISLKVLQFLEQNMRPHHQFFNILDIASVLQKYIERELQPTAKAEEPTGEEIISTILQFPIKMEKRMSENVLHSFQLRRDQALQALLEQLRSVFIYWGRNTLSYEYINEYIYNQQLRILNNQNVDEDYMQIGEKRVRIDENLKLCIMPLAYSGDEQSSRIRDLSFRENMIGSEIQTVYAVTRETIRAVHIRPELIGIAGDYDRKGSNPTSCWYHYDTESISPKKQTLALSKTKNQEKTAMTSAEAKQIKANQLANLDEMMPSHQLLILKAEVWNSVMAIICMDQSFIVQPLASKTLQGYIGNLQRDIPPVVAYKESKEVYQEILGMHGYNDSSWLIITQRFIYLYEIPIPSQNIILLEQSNQRKDSPYKQNPLLILCQRLPTGCIKAKVLGQKHVALMLQSNCVVVIELIISNRGIFQGRPLRPEDNYFKITNKIYNDIQFKAICYNPKEKFLFFSDFGAYLIRLTFSPTHGDIEEEGPVHDKEQNQEINAQMIKNSYIQLKASRSKAQIFGIRELQEEHMESSQPYIQVYYIKEAREREHKHLLSLYKKQNKSPHTVIIKNQTRQIITLITASPHYNTLITYQSETFEKPNLSQFQGDYYREWGNANLIKVWDARHMTIYQTLNIPIEASLFALRSNGLYFLTAEKGYLGFYQFNEDKKAMIGQAQQLILDRQNRQVFEQLGDEILLESGYLYFSEIVTTFNKFNNVRTHRTHISSLSMQKFPESNHLQTLPSEVTALAVKSRIYILQNSRQGVQACQLHIYNRQGLKEEMIIYSFHEDIDVATGKVRHQNYNQEFKFIKKINHNQFEVILWNSDCLRLIGLSRQESLTVIFNRSKIAKGYEEIELFREIKGIQISGSKMLIYYQQIAKGSRDYNASNPSSNRQAMNALVVRKRRKSSMLSRNFEQSNHNIAIFNCQNDRVIYKLLNISQKIKVLHIFNSLLLTRESDLEDSNTDILRVLDIAQPGKLLNKYLFSVKLQKYWTKKICMSQLKQYEFYELIPQKNEILQDIREFVLKKHIQIEQSKITVSPSNQLLLILVLRVQTQLLPIIGDSIIRGEVDFFIYTRNISRQLVNKDYKISRLQIGVKTKKNIKEYQTSTMRTENINQNKEILFQSLASSSNYGEIDMHNLCELILDKGHQIPSPDLTPKILSPGLITTSKTKDTYQVLSLKKEPIVKKLFEDKISKFNVLTSSNFKIVEFDEDKLSGVAVVSNKHLKVMALYNVSFDCTRPETDIEEPYRLSIAIDKIGILQSIMPKPNTLHSSTVNILEWNYQYKSEVDKMWDQTFNSIKTYLRKQRIEKTIEENNKKSTRKFSEKTQNKEQSLEPVMSRLSLDLKQLPALKIRKVQKLKRKLDHSERQYTEVTPRPVEVVKEQADNLSKMFKRWNINQAIARQRQAFEASNQSNEALSTNRYINRLLNSQKDKAERIQQLINVSRQIKEISRSPEEQQRSPSPEPVHTKLNQLQNIVKSSELANTSTLKSYLHQKRQEKTTTNMSNGQFTNQIPQLSRQQSSISSQLDLSLKHPALTDSPGVRVANISKLSLYSAVTKQTGIEYKNPGEFKTPIDPNSFEGRLTEKLEQLLLNSESEQKRMSTLPCQSPSRKKSHSNRNDFLKSRLTNKNSESVKQVIFSSQHSNNTRSRLGGTSFTNHISEALSPMRSPENIKTEPKSAIRYKTEQRQVSSPTKMQSPDRNKKESSLNSEKKAKEKLKQSQTMLKQIVLPQILSAKEKLALKMRQKRSYVKIIQDHMQDTSISSIRNGEERKKLVNILCEYK